LFDIFGHRTFALQWNKNKKSGLNDEFSTEIGFKPLNMSYKYIETVYFNLF